MASIIFCMFFLGPLMSLLQGAWLLGADAACFQSCATKAGSSLDMKTVAILAQEADDSR